MKTKQMCYNIEGTLTTDKWFQTNPGLSKIWTGNESCDENQVQQNNLKQTTVGTMGSYAGGVHVRPANMQAGTKKPETPQLAAG
jgi:hypothetical protein